MRKNTIDIPQEEMDRFHKAMDAERTEQDARLEKLIESEKANIPSNEAIINQVSFSQSRFSPKGSQSQGPIGQS